MRSTAWHWVFSSKLNTTARLGGFRYSPTTSTGLSSKCGSLLTLNVATFHGLRLWSVQTLAIVFLLRPSRLVSERASAGPLGLIRLVVERRLARLVVSERLHDRVVPKPDDLQRLVALVSAALSLAAVDHHGQRTVRGDHRGDRKVPQRPDDAGRLDQAATDERCPVGVQPRGAVWGCGRPSGTAGGIGVAGRTDADRRPHSQRHRRTGPAGPELLQGTHTGHPRSPRAAHRVQISTVQQGFTWAATESRAHLRE